MLSGKAVTMMDALGVSLASILVVFTVLFVLYVSVSLYPSIFREKKAPETKAPAAPEKSPEDGDELLAVIAAAIRAYEGKKKRGGTFLARGRKDD